ncbi:MAG: CRTAC1 family protein [Planctomycetota bacterium]|nr:CRTAC1 family protein [Planctomycetota bacterium]
MRARTLLLVLVAASLVASCSEDPVESDTATQATPWFEEVALERGLLFEHESGHRTRHLMPEIMCGGGALADLDGDGDLDAYLVQSGSLLYPPEDRPGNALFLPGNALFLNDGAGFFEDATEGSGADDRGYGMGVACGDPDRDGDVDLYVTNVGRNVLLENDGTGRFADVTARARVGDPGFGASAAFLDYDHDGDQDILTLNYLAWSLATEIECFAGMGVPDYCSPQMYQAPARDVLYANLGDGTFRDVTVEAGLDQAFGTGLGLVTGDFDGDGLVDVFVANDGMPDQLWINQGAAGFADDAFFAGCAVDQDGRAKAGMGVTAGDVDGDGDLDLLVCNLAGETDSLFRNEGGHFRDATAVSGLGLTSRPFTRFGMAWLDFDHDGLFDLYQANGRVNLKSKVYSTDPYAEPNLLFRGTRGGRFEEVEPRGGTAELLIGTSRAAAFGDVDGDGAIDVLVVNRDGRAHLLLNIAPDRGRWILFRVVDEHGSDALGATLTIQAGDRSIRREVKSAYSYCAANDPRVHVGLGTVSEVTGVTVRWVDGSREAFGNFPAGRVAKLVRGAGEPVKE